MTKVKCNVARLSIAELILQSLLVAKEIDAHPVQFANPNPVPAVLKAKAEEVLQANAKAKTGSKAAYAGRDAKVNELRALLRSCINYVNSVANDNKELILISGFKPSAGKGTSKKPEPVKNLKAIFTNMRGTILLTWQHAAHTHSYNIYFTDNIQDRASWKLLNTVAGNKLLAEGLESGKRYFFKIVSIGTTQKSSSSSITSMIAG